MRTVYRIALACAFISTPLSLYGMSPAEFADLAEKTAFSSLFFKDDCDKAIKYYSIAIRLDSNRPMAYVGRGRAHLGLNIIPGLPIWGFLHRADSPNLDESLADYSEAIRSCSDSAKYPGLYCDRACIYLMRKEWNKAIVDFSKTLKLDPQFICAFLGRGDAYMEKGKLDKAIADYAKAIEADSEWIEAYDYRIKANAKKGEWDKVIADYAEQIRITNEIDKTAVPFLYWGLGHAYLSKGDEKNAAFDFHRAFHAPSNLCDTYCGPLFYNDDGAIRKVFSREADYFAYLDREIENHTALLKFEKNQPMAIWYRALAYMGKGDTKKAIADFTEVIRLDPKADPAYLRRAVAYLKEGNADKAIADCTEHNETIAVADKTVFRIRGDAYYAKRKWDKVIEDYQKSINAGLILSLTSRENKCFLIRRGTAYMKKEDHKKAAEDFKTVLGIDKDTDIFKPVCNNLSKKGLRKIEIVCSHLIRLEPNCARAFCCRGQVYEALNLPDMAIADYTDAIMLNPKGTPRPKDIPGIHRVRGFNAPDYNEAIRLRGNLYKKLGEWDNALADSAKWINLDRICGEAYANRSEIYMKKGELKKAISDCKSAIGAGASPEESYLRMCEANIKRGELDHALAAYTRAIEQRGLKSVRLYNARGDLYAKTGKLEEATADYEQAIRRSKLDAWQAYAGLGNVQAETGELDKALDNFTIAIAIHPDNPTIWNHRGEVYEKLGKHEKAIADFSEAIRLDPEYAPAYRGKADVLKSLGQIKEANINYRKADALDAAR